LARVELREVTKVYPGGVEALSRVSLEIADGEFLVILGPSGSGKSTLLRIVAGLEPLSRGSLWIDGRRADGAAPCERDVAMVFQTPALYPHLSAFENMAFGLRARRVGGAEVHERVHKAAAQLGLTDLLERRPKALSGGQRQRVALGRAIVRQAAIVLLDEPLSNLDTPLRASARADLIELHQRYSGTIVMVTHDQSEALALGDRVAVLSGGQVVQVGIPTDVYRRPATQFVAAFIGSPPMNLLPCEVQSVDEKLRLRVVGAEPAAGIEAARRASWAAPLARRGEGPVCLGVRAEHIETSTSALSPLTASDLIVQTRVKHLEPLGHATLATLLFGQERCLKVRLAGTNPARINDALSARLDLTQAVWFDPATGTLLS